MKTLLIISGGIEAVAGIKIAKEMGLRVVVSDAYEKAPGFAFADHQLIASTYDVEETVRVAQAFHEEVIALDGVISIASDVPRTVAAVAEALSLPGIPMESAVLATDKLAMKQKFRLDQVPVPQFTALDDLGMLRSIVEEWSYPLVIKPMDSRGSRGVVLLKEGVDLGWAWQEAFSNSPTGRVMVERFLDGPQVSTEAIVLDGECYTVGFSDRNYEYMEKYAPFIIENGGDLPSFLDPSIQADVKVLMGNAARSIGVRNGVVKGDIVVHQGQAYVIELATRLSGGHFCSHEIPLNNGVAFVENAIRIALGVPVDPSELEPKFNRHVCQRYFMLDEDMQDDIRVEQLLDQEGIAFAIINDRVKNEQDQPVNSGGWQAMAIAVGDSREHAQELVRKAFDSIRRT